MVVRNNLALSLMVLLSCSALSGAWAADPVATVGVRAISERALDDAVQELLNSRFFHRTVAGERLLELQRDQLQALVNRELNLLGGLDRGMKLPMDEAEKQRAALAARLGAATYKQSLKARGWSQSDHARLLAERLLAERAYQRFVFDPSKATDAEVKAAFLANPAPWRLPEALHIEHILLKVAPDAGKETWSAREGEAAKIVTRLKGGAQFADLASQMSDDPYRVKGGDLGWIHRGRLIEPLESAAWKGKVGDLVGPLRSTEGWHIMRIAEHRAERAMSVDEVAPMLRKQIEDQRRKTLEETWYEELRRRHKVVILDPELQGKAK